MSQAVPIDNVIDDDEIYKFTKSRRKAPGFVCGDAERGAATL